MELFSRCLRVLAQSGSTFLPWQRTYVYQTCPWHHQKDMVIGWIPGLKRILETWINRANNTKLKCRRVEYKVLYLDSRKQIECPRKIEEAHSTPSLHYNYRTWTDAWILKSKQIGVKDQNTKCSKNSTEFPGVFSPFPFHYPQAWTLNTQKWRPGTDRQNSKRNLVLVWQVRKETPNAQSEGNSVFPLFSPLSHTPAPRQFRWDHGGNSAWGSNSSLQA